LGVDIRLDLLHHFGKRSVLLHLLFDLLDGVEDGGVVPVVKDLADLIQTEIRHGADQVHGNLPGGDRVPHPLLAPDHGLVQTVIFGDILKDGLRRGDILVAAAQHVLDGPGDGFFVRVVAQQILVGQDLVDGALQLADVGGDVFGDVGGDFVRQLHAQQGGLVFHDG
ncbi:terminase small subunit, partial [Dysosmobacter welbionis]